jgi:transcription elongation factor Elf1
MGLPMALDGLPDHLKLKSAVECPNCKRQVSSFLKKKSPSGEPIAVCGLCKKQIPNSFLSDIKAHL